MIWVAVSPGELLDRLAILEVKAERMKDPDKRRAVRAELAELLRRHPAPAAATPGLYAGLLEVNGRLWELVDGTRVCEREEDFGPRFVALSRQVYRENDRRDRLKRLVNEALGAGAAAGEQKEYEGYEDCPGVERAVREAWRPGQIEETAQYQCRVSKP